MIKDYQSLNKVLASINDKLKILVTDTSIENLSESEIIELDIHLNLSEHLMSQLIHTHRTTCDKITNLKYSRCKHNKIRDYENDDIAHTSYVCSKCGMMM